MFSNSLLAKYLGLGSMPKTMNFATDAASNSDGTSSASVSFSAKARDGDIEATASMDLTNGEGLGLSSAMETKASGDEASLEIQLSGSIDGDKISSDMDVQAAAQGPGDVSIDAETSIHEDDETLMTFGGTSEVSGNDPDGSVNISAELDESDTPNRQPMISGESEANAVVDDDAAAEADVETSFEAFSDQIEIVSDSRDKTTTTDAGLLLLSDMSAVEATVLETDEVVSQQIIPEVIELDSPVSFFDLW
jgi:hypothetical protein